MTALRQRSTTTSMGSSHRCDCVVQHECTAGRASTLGADNYHVQLMLAASQPGAKLASLQTSIRNAAGPRAADISTVVTEYSQLGSGHPVNTQLLQDIWLSRRPAVVFITHHVDEAIFLADRVLVMSARPGRICEDIAVSSPRPRRATLLTDPRFNSLKKQAWQALHPE